MRAAWLIAPVAMLGLGASLLANRQTPPAAQMVPPPAEGPAAREQQVAVLAGGCFWGMEGLFEHVKGVISVTSGYAGGSRASAHYAQVSSEQTNHAEAIRIVYDPARINYGQLLQIYFYAAHDPTQINAQYPDEGTSYRSAIFPQNAAQRETARAYISALGKARAFGKPVATRIETGNFYPAEAFHQDFMRRHPHHPYIEAWDVPRLARFKARFAQFYK